MADFFLLAVSAVPLVMALDSGVMLNKFHFAEKVDNAIAAVDI